MKNIYLSCLIAMLLFPAALHGQDLNSKKRKSTVAQPHAFSSKQIAGGSSRNSLTASRVKSPVALTKRPGDRIVYDEKGLPRFISTQRDVSTSRMITRKDARTGAMDYLGEIASLLHTDDATGEFQIQQIKTGEDRKSHVRLTQFYKNVPIYGAESVLHLNEFGEGESFNGKVVAIEASVDVKPTLSVVDVERSIQTKGKTLNELERSLVQYAAPHSELCLYEYKGLKSSYVLAYHVIAYPSIHRRMEYFVDAHSGRILHEFSSTCHADGPRTASANDLNGVSRTINTYLKGSTLFLLDVSRAMFNSSGTDLPDNPVGGILTVDMDGTHGDNTTIKHITSSTAANTWAAKNVSAHFNAGFAYNYFLTKHSRNSIDGINGTIISVVNVPDEDGTALDNAFWNGKAMFYGNGNTGFKPLAGGLDVAGHEMTHGVVQNTANLEYQGESGAINESMADVFGVMMDPADWTIGEDVVKTSVFPSGALRSLSDPHNGGTSLNDNGFQPKHMNEKYTGNQDNGGVHINSGIPNHAFFKYAQAVTADKAARVFYKALDEYLTKSSQFIDLRIAVVQAATALFGASSAEVTQAKAAFDFVGIVEGSGNSFDEVLPANPGTEFLLVNNTNTSLDVSVFRIKVVSEDDDVLTKTKTVSKPSVTDDGSAAVFVGEDKKIHVVITDPDLEANEFILQDEPIWSNAVVSKGGTRIAAVKSSPENKIYVYDFFSEQWAAFELYNPTFSEGVTSGGPLYADALEWDYSGEFLVYDAFNSIKYNNSATIEYWDVNFMRVWDNATMDFGDGTVQKLFTSLPDGVSIGNPAFSKRSPNVLAFDYIDEGNDEYNVLGCNAETGDVDFIASNNALGYPTFNISDTRVAYSRIFEGKFITAYVTLNADKISSNDDWIGLYDETKWPVYYATGFRKFEDNVVTGVEGGTTKFTMSCYPNPFTDEISVALANGELRNSTIEIFNVMGQKVTDYALSSSGDDAVTMKFQDLSPGSYVVKVKGAMHGACRILKVR